MRFVVSTAARAPATRPSCALNVAVLAACLLVAICLVRGPALAADSHTIATGATTDITEWSTCKRVTNGHASSLSIFVPTKTSAEWTSFFTYPPAGVTIATCPPACGGTSVGGYCWYFGAGGESCDTVCASHGGCDITGTRDYAGSAGSLANCQAVLSALGQGSGAIDDFPNNSVNLGCGKFGSFTNMSPHLMRDYYNATTCSAAGLASPLADQRACACSS